MSRYDFDLIVLGAGSGGVRAARMAASTGVRVAIVEADRFGGTCVIRGCVPKKLLVYAAQKAQALEDMKGYGFNVEGVSFDWSKLIKAKNEEIDRLEGVYKNLLKTSQVEMIEGYGKILDPHIIDVNGRKYTTERILIAVGGQPTLPNIPGIEYAITSNEALNLPDLPKSIFIVGGGYIALEFAGIFNQLGVDVTIAIRRSRLLRGFDDDIRDYIGKAIQGRGIRLLGNTEVKEIRKLSKGYEVFFSDGKTHVTDLVMYATGRHPNTKNLGLENADITVKSNSGVIPVNEFSQTDQPNIYAVGDVTGRVALTPVAIKEAEYFVETVYRNNPKTVDYRQIPFAVFSQPSVGRLGLNEQEARAEGPVKIFRTTFRSMKNVLSGRQENVLIKMIVDATTDRVVGCHMVGQDAAEIIQGMAVAMKCGATKAQFDATVALHPTTAEEFVLMRNPVVESFCCDLFFLRLHCER